MSLVIKSPYTVCDAIIFRVVLFHTIFPDIHESLLISTEFPIAGNTLRLVSVVSMSTGYVEAAGTAQSAIGGQSHVGGTSWTRRARD